MVVIYCLHSGFTICLSNVPCLLLTFGSAFNPRSHVAVSWHVSLISSSMEQGFHVLWSPWQFKRIQARCLPVWTRLSLVISEGEHGAESGAPGPHFSKVPPSRSSVALEIKALNMWALGKHSRCKLQRAKWWETEVQSQAAAGSFFLECIHIHYVAPFQVFSRAFRVSNWL